MKNSKYEKIFLQEIVKKSKTMMEVLFNLGLKKSGGNHSYIKSLIKKYEINIDHFLGPGNWNKGRTPPTKHTEESFIEEVLCENGKGWRSSAIKDKLLTLGLKEDICEICFQKNVWNGLKLVLQLDHIDGNNKNNKLNNLRIICPNCHSQTETFSGKNNKPD